MSVNGGGDGEERMEDHEAEMAATQAEEEMKEEMSRLSEREYQKMAADLRWEVLEYAEAHPDKPVTELAEFFGIKEGTIRAWKAHRTMGTYREQGAPSPRETPRPKGRQRDLFRERKDEKALPFIERKRYSNFIHYFDKTPPGIVCPHFYVLAHANGCPYSCDYCYLRLTLRHYPEPTVFTNTARLFQELRDWLIYTPEPSVINSGELSDSLAWDNHTALSDNLIPLFANQSRHKLLLVTKSEQVERLLDFEPCPFVIVSFSVNASEVSRRYEKGAPPPERRLSAARRLREAGWEVRVRIDPLIPVEGWKDAYSETADLVNEVEPSVVTLGSLRFFKNLLQHGPKDTDVFSYGVSHNDPDGRLRVDEGTRIEMYRRMIDRLCCLRIGLCKETEKVHSELGLPGINQSCNCTVE